MAVEGSDFPALGVSQDAGVAEHAGVKFGFFLEFHGVGAGGGGHAPDFEAVGSHCHFAHSGHFGGRERGYDSGSLFAGGGHGVAQRHFLQQGGEVDGFHDFKIFVGSVVA